MPATAPAQFCWSEARRRLGIRASTRFPWHVIGMCRPDRIAAFALVALALAQGCGHDEPATQPAKTAGGEAATPQPLGNAPSSQMAVEPREPAAPVDPKSVSSEPSPLLKQPEPAPSPPQSQAAPTYAPTQPPAPRREAYPTETSTQWVWAPGYWYWHSGQYVWISGAWIPARQGHVYVAARWAHTGRGWQFVPGGWAVSAYDPIVYPVYPYDPFYYRDYWHHRHHGHYGHHHHHRRDYGRSRQPTFVRPEGSLGVRRVSPGRSSSRVRVRAR